MQPHYFDVRAPAHFRVRPDLLAELCVTDAVQSFLPRDRDAYRSWLCVTGQSEAETPFESLQAVVGKGYVPPVRHVLQKVQLPRVKWSLALITDARGRAARVEAGGLFEFVFRRGCEFAAAHGYTWEEAHARFSPPPDVNMGPKRRLADWCLGVAGVDGEIAIIDQSTQGAVQAFLSYRQRFGTPRFTASTTEL